MNFNDVYDIYIDRVYRFVNIKLGNKQDAEDVTSKIFEKIYLNLESYNEEKGNLDTWVFAITRNEIASHYRAKKVQTVCIDSVGEIIDSNHSPHKAAEIKFENKKLLEAVESLNENEKTAVAYKYGAGLKNTEIAELMGISSSNVGVVLFRSMKKLKLLLEG